MELRYLEIFCAVVEFKSFSKAAQALRLTQPTVSIHIKALEDEFSTKLLDRLGRTVLPTRAGEILYGYARDIVSIKEEARLAMEQLISTMSGKLIVGASTIPGEYILPPLLSQFKNAYPDVFPTLKIGDTSDIHESVLRGEVDMGLVGAVMRDKNIISRKFLDDELILVAPSNFKASVLHRRELKGVPLLIREMGSGSRYSLEEYLKKNRVDIESLHIVAEMGSTQALMQAVKSGMGLAFISRLSVVDEIEQEALKPVTLKGFTIIRHFHIITHRLRSNSRICKTFIEFISRKEIELSKHHIRKS